MFTVMFNTLLDLLVGIHGLSRDYEDLLYVSC